MQSKSAVKIIDKLPRAKRALLTKRVLARSAEIHSTEQRLWMAVIFSAIDDLSMTGMSPFHGSAARYVDSELFEIHCQIVDLNPEYVRSVLQRAHLIASTNANEVTCAA